MTIDEYVEKILGIKSPSSNIDLKIKTIQVNEHKKVVAVVFGDGGKEIIKCCNSDQFDVNIGVALAIAQHICGSKSKFHKLVEKKSKYIQKVNKNQKGNK